MSRIDPRRTLRRLARLRGQRGLTLIELMVALSILAILLTIGIPSFRGLILDNQRATTANELLASFQLARSEMARQGTVVSVCPSMDGENCTGGSDWTTGWMVFVDNNPGGGTTGVRDAGEVVLRFTQASTPNTLPGNQGFFSFRPFNRVSTAGSVAVCDKRGDGDARWIVVSRAGRARVEKAPPTAAAPKCPI